MDRITLDTLTTSQFEPLCNPVEVFDTAGRAIGVFIPSCAERLRGQPRLDFTAIDREITESANQCRSLEEIWSTLGAK